MQTVLGTLQADLDRASTLADDAADFNEWTDGLDAWVDARDALSAREAELDLDATAVYAWPDCLDHEWCVVACWQDTVDAWLEPCLGEWVSG